MRFQNQVPRNAGHFAYGCYLQFTKVLMKTSRDFDPGWFEVQVAAMRSILQSHGSIFRKDYFALLFLFQLYMQKTNLAVSSIEFPF